jgi:hypothetical protein
MKLRTHLEHEERTHMIKDFKSIPYVDTNVGTYDSDIVSTTSTSTQSHLQNYLANTNNIVECPLSNDVIFRRGKTMNVHLGNVNFQNLIESRIYEHSIDLDTPPLRRTELEIEVFNEVLKPVKNNGSYGGGGGGGGHSGRFLTWDMKKQWWLVIRSEDEIRIKIHYAFRDFRKKMLRTQQKQQKVQTVTNLNSLFEHQDGQKKIRYNDNDNTNSSSSTDGGCCNENDGGCTGNSTACGYFFSTDDGSYAYLDDGLSLSSQ